MKKTYSLLAAIVACLFVLFLNSCDKTSDLEKCKADPMCEYFRCNVDGKPWKPYCESSFLGCEAVDVQYYKELNGGGLTIKASKENDTSGFRIVNINIQDTDTEYDMYFLPNNRSKYFIKVAGDWDEYLVDTSTINILRFSKIDTVNFILEGTFQFTGINENGLKKEITEGQFRQHYRF